MMYATVIAAVGESADPSWRASAIGSYRFWRDSGYAVGGLLLGYATDHAGYQTAVYVTAVFMSCVAAVFLAFFSEVVEGDLEHERLNQEFQKTFSGGGKARALGKVKATAEAQA